MGFKTAKEFNENMYKGVFRLVNDGDYADVVFLYQNPDDVLIADVHYIKTSDFTGYAHCTGRDCPACSRGIRVQTKLFIPLYNIADNEIQFFDRSARFCAQLEKDVLSKYPNPSEFVFRITRHGEPNSVDTSYEIVAIARNTTYSYESILAANKATMPDYYNHICKELSAHEMLAMFTDPTRGLDDYQAVPRPAVYAPESATSFPTEFDVPDVAVTTVDANTIQPEDADDVVF